MAYEVYECECSHAPEDHRRGEGNFKLSAGRDGWWTGFIFCAHIEYVFCNYGEKHTVECGCTYIDGESRLERRLSELEVSE